MLNRQESGPFSPFMGKRVPSQAAVADAGVVHLRSVPPVPNTGVAQSNAGDSRARVLVVDDDEHLLRTMARHLTQQGCTVRTATCGQEALSLLRAGHFDVVLSDINMPGMNGLSLLGEVRRCDPLVPVVLITGYPTIDSAKVAIEQGAFTYLTKPLEPAQVQSCVERAMQIRRLAHIKHEAAELWDDPEGKPSDRAGLEARFERALQKLWIAYQPVVTAKDGAMFGYEALMRSDEPTLAHPAALLETAEQLNRLQLLGRHTRGLVTRPLPHMAEGLSLLVNLHATELLDDSLLDRTAPLSRVASRIVLEITERASLDRIPNVRGRVRALRDLGFRIAVDDMGAGYAGLSSFALLEPDIVKFDMSIVRDVDRHRMKQKLIQSMTKLCHEMGILVVAEGVETASERATLCDLGCDLLQGYLVARPGPPFPHVYP